MRKRTNHQISKGVNFAVVLAAGTSQRMQGIDKLFFPLKRKPLIIHTLEVFQRHPQVKKIVLVGNKDKLKKLKHLVKKYKINKVALIVKGGKERQHSSFFGLTALKDLKAKTGDIILFHNGANPLITLREIRQVIEMAKKYGAAILAQPLKDTIKQVNSRGFIIKTLDRRKFFLAQTPQAIEYSLAKRAFKKANLNRFIGTDDVSLVEKLGKKVKIIPCSYLNIKVTTREDLQIVKSLIK